MPLFYLSGCFLFLAPLHLFFLFILPVFSFLFGHVLRAVVFSMARAPGRSCGALPGIAGLCSVSRRSSAWPESVSLRV